MTAYVWPPGCDLPGCKHHFAHNMAARGCVCPGWFDGGGWHLIERNSHCTAHEITGAEVPPARWQAHHGAPVEPTLIIPPRQMTCGLCGWHGLAADAPDHQPAPHGHAADGPWGCCGRCRRLHDSQPGQAARIAAVMAAVRRAIPATDDGEAADEYRTGIFDRPWEA